MKFFILAAAISYLFTATIFAQEERKVLVEVFTNSNCPLCPPAHNAVNSYLAGQNGDKINYIFYHMVYPYSDDPLYHQSMEGSDARNSYYNPVQATPQGWFDGIHQGSASGWAASLDNLITVESPLKIILSGTRSSTQFNINANVTRTGEIPDSDLVIHFVAVEDLYYAGRNSIVYHKHVMRKMFPAPEGQQFTIDMNETKNISQMIDIDPLWDADSLSVVVFVQSIRSMTVYQSETIGYNELTATGVDETENTPADFILEQNYPNPFNPTTKINFNLPKESNVKIYVYNMLGERVKELVNGQVSAGGHTIIFNAENLASGMYIYQVEVETLTGNTAFRTARKMILLK